jgi:hypothetical protein
VGNEYDEPGSRFGGGTRLRSLEARRSRLDLVLVRYAVMTRFVHVDIRHRVDWVGVWSLELKELG